jgi:uncharacterized protein YdeI (YjbR/CyaY-like superfamily)
MAAKEIAAKKKTASRLKRPRYPMPAFMRSALTKRGLMKAYRERPPFQQNDYIGWIMRAKREATQQKRLEQMLDELENGSVYMNMPWRVVARR